MTAAIVSLVWGAGPGAGSVAAQEVEPEGRWTVAFELGEIPTAGSFKAGISVGYHLNERAWIGFAYQLPDSIRRGRHSFNAQGTGLDGLSASAERVGQRAYLQARVRPTRHSPFLSLGVVLNARDVETISFDARERTVAGAASTGPLEVTIARPLGVRPAVGLGYEYATSSGLTAFVEWSGWWMFGAPEPDVRLRGPGVSPALRTRWIAASHGTSPAARSTATTSSSSASATRASLGSRCVGPGTTRAVIRSAA